MLQEATAAAVCEAPVRPVYREQYTVGATRKCSAWRHRLTVRHGWHHPAWRAHGCAYDARLDGDGTARLSITVKSVPPAASLQSAQVSSLHRGHTATWRLSVVNERQTTGGAASHPLALAFADQEDNTNGQSTVCHAQAGHMTVKTRWHSHRIPRPPPPCPVTVSGQLVC